MIQPSNGTRAGNNNNNLGHLYGAIIQNIVIMLAYGGAVELVTFYAHALGRPMSSHDYHIHLCTNCLLLIFTRLYTAELLDNFSPYQSGIKANTPVCQPIANHRLCDLH